MDGGEVLGHEETEDGKDEEKVQSSEEAKRMGAKPIERGVRTLVDPRTPTEEEKAEHEKTKLFVPKLVSSLREGQRQRHGATAKPRAKARVNASARTKAKAQAKATAKGKGKDRSNGKGKCGRQRHRQWHG